MSYLLLEWILVEGVLGAYLDLGEVLQVINEMAQGNEKTVFVVGKDIFCNTILEQ